ncbi:DUF2399 domain-containing protein [Streptomyces sp. NBC_00162]|uniref:DUF2399 domain-containing protein n=1 Tax=Streptomyces sp. NBC_00162 TaxID=2903629 RepID=UPI00214C2B15|nr:DUF2399 domain-containing protein [Streptomyces sp. NBC_00162]UUU45129.1 DUF2399 domain-containing protein [Streptomyces sp. NBC_00162]
MNCPLCNGACAEADLVPLLSPELTWLWQALAAAADRRGDETLTSGTPVTVLLPVSAAQCAAATGLIGGRPPEPGQRRRLNLEELAAAVAIRGPALTPGAVAAHACNRRLAAKARSRAEHTAASDRIRSLLEHSAADLPHHVRERIQPATAFTRLHKLGWITRLLKTPDPETLLTQALQVAARLPPPGRRIDRRILVPGNPHALDAGTLPALVLALTGTSATRGRSSWVHLGVDCDDLLGGLIITGVTPRGWQIPPGATFALPPRELADITWQPPDKNNEWAFVTENPSVLAAASNHALANDGVRTPRVICTAGTPSQLECQAIGALSTAGWRIAIRADFDQAGLAHMRALLAAAPTALPWRMSAADYLQAAPKGTDILHLQESDAPWDPFLVTAMLTQSTPVYEEDLLVKLLADIADGRPELIEA